MTPYALSRLLIYLVLSVGAIAMAFPFYWMLATSLKSPRRPSRPGPSGFPSGSSPPTGGWPPG